MMAVDAAKRIAQLGASLQWDRGRWIWLLLIVLLLNALFALGDGVTWTLRYDRAAIGAGDWWRLLTAHFVHLDGHHLLLNELGLVLVWALFAQDYDAVDWCIIVCTGSLAISSGLWWLSPRVAWYVGASGLLHAIMAAGTVRHLVARAWDRWILLGGLIVKIGYEQLTERAGRSAPLIVVDAHLYGAAAGFAVGAVLCWRMAIIAGRARR